MSPATVSLVDALSVKIGSDSAASPRQSPHVVLFESFSFKDMYKSSSSDSMAHFESIITGRLENRKETITTVVPVCDDVKDDDDVDYPQSLQFWNIQILNINSRVYFSS